jgi:hypothetical protein
MLTLELRCAGSEKGIVPADVSIYCCCDVGDWVL